MEKAYLYIKKLIALLLSFTVMYLVSGWIPETNYSGFLFTPVFASGQSVFSLMAGFLVLSFMHFKITGLKPEYLYGMKKADTYLNRKGGFWLLFKWIFSLFGLVYDIIAWSVNGVYVLFLIIIDFLLLIKTILYWIIHAIIWFLRLFVPPIIFIYRNSIYYLLRWPWWIYKLTYRNISISVNKNFYFVSLWGAVLSIFLITLFFGIGRLVGIDGVVFIGAIFSVLPLVWSYGEISAMRFEDRAEEDYSHVRTKFDSGFDAVKAVLFYMLIFLIGILAEILLDIMGWIPNLGFSLLGISLNINTFISLVLIFVFVILVFAKVLMPVHIVHNSDYESNLENSGRFLEVIGKKFLRYITAHIPGSFFAGLLSIIPVLLVGLAVSLTFQLKDGIMESRINTLEARKYTIEIKDKYVLEQRIERLNYYKAFPMNIFGDFVNLKDYSERKKNIQMNLVGLNNQFNQVEKLFREDIDSLNFVINHLKNNAEVESYALLKNAEQTLENKKSSMEDWRLQKLDEELEMTAELMNVKGMIYQLPIVFLLVIIWLSLFGGLILAVIISYFGNVYHELYNFKENDQPTYFKAQIMEINSSDRNQPLLGFTLLFVLAVVLFALSSNVGQLISKIII